MIIEPEAAIVDPLHEATASRAEWTRANVGELLPGVVTPLTATTTGRICETAGRAAWHALGVLPAAEVPVPGDEDRRQNVFFHGRLCLNLTFVRELVARIPGADLQAFEEAVTGDATVAAVHTGPRRPFTAQARTGLRCGWAAVTVGRRVRRLRASTDEWWRAAIGRCGTADRATATLLLVDACARMHEVLRHGIVASMFAQGAYSRLGELARRRGMPGLETALATGYRDLEEEVLARDVVALARGDLDQHRFLDRHGYQSSAQYDPAGRSWREDPDLLVPMLERIRELSGAASADRRARRQAEAQTAAARVLLRGASRSERATIRGLLWLAHHFVVLRECQKVSGLQAVDVLRAAARALGTALVRDDILDDADDVFLLTLAEARGGAVGDARRLVAARRAMMTAHAAVVLPDRWLGLPTSTAVADQPVNDREEVRGAPASAGVVDGDAVVAADSASAAAMEPGAVLVCHTTDPSWTPALLVAAAVVVDVGGPMSHGAIVARELGVPCVIGTKVGTSVIGTGDRVRVDGDTGVVRILSRGGRGDE